MRGCLKIAGILLLLVVLCLVITIVGVYISSSNKFDQTYDVQAQAVTIPDDPESIARGKYLFDAVAVCNECHGDDLAGTELADDFFIGTLYASNLTTGQGGVGDEYTDEDWILAIRHGIGKDKKGLFIMPSEDFYHLTDEDLGAIIAYIKSVPPVDKELPEVSVGPIMRTGYVLAGMPLIPAEDIDHDAPRPESVEPGVTAEYGGYLATIGCSGCHGDDFAGGVVAGPPGSPESADITPGGVLGDYTAETFINFIHTGLDPEGNAIDNEIMPWQAFSDMTDDDLEAIYLYLSSLPASESEE